MFSIKIQTAGQIGTKFGTEVVLEGGEKVLEDFWPSTPPPRVQGASGASTMCFGENFIKQKLQGTPDLVGVGNLFRPQIQIWKDLGPNPSGDMVTHYEG